MVAHDCGKRTLLDTIDHLAQTSGDVVWARYAESSEAFARAELQAVTFASLANAINRLAWHFDTTLPPLASPDSQHLCYIGPNDIRYFIVACAACKTGRKALFTSPRNDLEAHLHLLDSLRCKILLGAKEGSHSKTCSALKASRDLSYAELPALNTLLMEKQEPPYPWTHQFEDIATETMVVMHTTGSTGLPQPVCISHGLLATVDAQQLLPSVEGRHVTAHNWADCAVYTALPPFHAAAFNFFCFSIFQSTQLVCGPPERPPALDIIDGMLDMQIANAAVLPASLLAELSTDISMLPKLAQWSSVIFGGAPLAQAAGDALWQHTKVLQILGSTEVFNIPELEPRSCDEWAYHHYHPALGIDFRPHSNEAHELVFVRKSDAAIHQGAFWTFPALEEYPMNDLYEQHPSKPEIWKYRGRVDDVIVLANGEKLNPTAVESMIAQEKGVKSALVVGTGRTQLALIVEREEVLGSNAEGEKASVMQAVERANKILPAHAQIHATHIEMLSPPNVFLRSSKGEIRRKVTVDALAGLIDGIYQSAEAQDSCTLALDFSSPKALSGTLTSLICDDFLRKRGILPTDNFFEHGFDSLLTLKLTLRLQREVDNHNTTSQVKLAPRAIYQNPSVQALSGVLLDKLNGADEQVTDDQKEMQQQLDHFTDYLHRLAKVKQKLSAPARTVVLLTGSTGSLGSYILNRLIKTRSVAKIICLNRKGSGAKKQSQANHARGLSTDFSKVEFCEADLSKPDFGLLPEEFLRLSQEVSHIIHNAWSVNFNSSLRSFEPHLQGCCHLIELAHAAPHHVQTVFVSSIGAANNWGAAHEGWVPEEKLSDFTVAESMGYAQSKLLAELLFAHAQEELGAEVAVCRVGQIAGPVTIDGGMWNSKEWFPSILLSCKALGRVPRDLGAMDRMDWIPIDLLSEMLVSTLLNRSPGSGSSCGFLHFVNPQDTYWRDVVHSLADWGANKVEVVEYQEWLAALQDVVNDSDKESEVPAIKLLDFFEDIGQSDTQRSERPKFSTATTQHRCNALAEVQPVSVDWLQKWLDQWHLDLKLL